MTPQELEVLKKSIDTLIDTKIVKKSEDAAPAAAAGAKATDSKETADEGEKPKEGEEEKDGTRGRPTDPSTTQHRSPDGATTAPSYPENVSSPAVTLQNETTVAKSTVEVSKEDFEFLKKAKADKEAAASAETLRKAKAETTDLIKSAVAEATKGSKEEIAKLKKSLDDQSALLNKALSVPQQRQSIASVASLEKSFGTNEPGTRPESFSKSEMGDAAERLFKAGKISQEQVIELDMTGMIYDARARKLIEQELTRTR